jgi:hypothetical protein
MYDARSIPLVSNDAWFRVSGGIVARRKGHVHLVAASVAWVCCGLFGVVVPVKATDVSGQVLGTTYATIMANYWGVINSNVASGGHYVRRVTPYPCALTPSGRVAQCQLAAALFDEFISNPACAGRADCAFSSVLIFGGKHKLDWRDILTGLDMAQWSWELLHWCMNTPECATPCPECTSPTWCDGEGVLLQGCDGGPVNPFLNDLSNMANQGFDELMINYYTNTNKGIGWSPDGLGPWGLDSNEPMQGGTCPDPGILICL